MNISAIFILRPVMTTLVMAGVMLFGLIAFFTLPIDDLPAVDFPYIVVSAGLPGASPETMASAVATPLEKQFSNIAGVESMTSSNRMGSSTIVLQFTLDRKLDGAAEDIQAAINAARTLLPAAMPTPPTLQKVNPADSPILTIALSSATLPLYVVDEYAENMLSPRISMISDVAQVQVWGSQIYAPHVQVDPRKLAVLGIGIDEVCSTIQNSNVNLPTGALYGPSTSYNVRVNGQCSNAADLRPLIVKYKNGAPVRLSDVGDVIDSVKTDKRATWYKSNLGTERAIVLGVYKQPNTNTIQIVDNVKQMLQSFKAAMPGSVRLNVLYDRSRSIRNSVAEVERTLGITIVIVVLVIYFFLGNPSTTLIASLSLPISLLGTFAAMKLLGFTLNNITLMAITLCVGFVVDDAIVVLENIICHVEQGMPAFQAAIRGAREIGFTILAMTSSLAAVFIPVLLMGGIIGRIFYQFAVTIIAAVVISGIVSLSLTPMLCSRFLRHTAPAERGFNAISRKIIELWSKFYELTLKLALKNRDFVVAIFLLTIAASLMMLQMVPKGFLPSGDNGNINGTVIANEGISFQNMIKHQKQVEKIIDTCPDVESCMSSVGNGLMNEGNINMYLKPLSERKSTPDQIIASLRKKCEGLIGMKYIMQNASNGQNQLTISSSDMVKLYASANKLQKVLKEIPGITDINADLRLKDLRLKINIDRNKCSKLGISLQKVQDALSSAYGSRQVSAIYTPTNQYWVILEVQPKYYEDPNMLDWLSIRSPSGTLVPLNAVATMIRTAGPIEVNHLGQLPSVTITFNVEQGYPLNVAMEDIKKGAEKILPAEVSFSFQGTTKQFEATTKNFGFLLVISILVIYIVLGILYESFIHPLTILSGLPSAGLGALITLCLFNKPLDIYGCLGMILLIGIVKKNAIMMIDYAVEAQREEGLSPEEAIKKACLVRFRPIMMTTLAALLGSLPIALGTGAGSETRQPLGLSIVGGLMLSQLVTLYVTPVFFLYLDRLEKWMAHCRMLKSAKVLCSDFRLT